MPPPSALKIKTSSVTRLIKEERSYHKELASAKSKLEKMEANNDDFYEIKQQKKVVSETEAMIPEVQKRLEQAVEVLEIQLEDIEEETEETKLAALALEEARLVYAGQTKIAGDELFTDVS